MLKNVVFILLFLFFSLSHASQEESVMVSQYGCIVLSQTLGGVALERDSGTLKEEHLKQLKTVQGLPKQVISLVSQEINKVYGIYRELPPELIYQLFLNNCLVLNGDVSKLMDKQT